MTKLQVIRLITKVCWLLSGIILMAYGLLLALTGFLGEKPLPSVCWGPIVFGAGLFLTGVFFIRLAKNTG